MKETKLYRPEIDGLRAFAVLSVLFFHAEFAWIPGGFLGVDIFFVISGYLITGIIEREVRGGQFSLARFYERRARRILPVLLFVLLVSFPFATWLLLPDELLLFSKSVFATLFFVSNFFFYGETGYFQSSTDFMPLIHTWSLSIEEQFYLVFPIVLLLFLRAPRFLLAGFAILSLFSLATSGYLSARSPSFNFYFTISRVFEFLVGAMIALRPIRSLVVPRWFRNGAGLVGILFIFWGFLYLDASFDTPNFWLLPPLLGCALILAFGGDGDVTSRFLTLAPLRGIGLISYSLYLWHQPIFTFGRLISGPELTVYEVVMAFGITATLSFLSWRFIELPFRNRNVVDLRLLTMSLSGALIVLSIAGVFGWISEGNEERYLAGLTQAQRQAYEIIQADRAEHGISRDDGLCKFHVKSETSLDEARLERCARDHGMGILVLGDSHAISLFNVFDNQTGPAFVVGLSRGGFRPSNPRNVAEFNDLVSRVSQLGVFGSVIYHQAGFYLVNGLDGSPGNRELFLDNRTDVFGADTFQLEVTERYLSAIATTLPEAGCVIWLGPKIDPFLPVRELYRTDAEEFSISHGNQRTLEDLDGLLQRRSDDWDFHYLSSVELIAFDPLIDFFNDGIAYFRDTDHWSAQGEERFGARLWDGFFDSFLGGERRECAHFANFLEASVLD